MQKKLCYFLFVVIFYLTSIREARAITFGSLTPDTGSTIYSGQSATISVNSQLSGNHPVIFNWNNSLVSWWKFNTDGDLTSNISGNTITGSASAASWTESGRYAGAYSFNGSSSFLDMGVPTAAQITNNLTLSAWINTTHTHEAYHDIIANQWQHSSSGMMITIYGASTIHVPFTDGISGIDSFDVTATITDGNWHLITVTFASGKIIIYVDGQEIDSKTSSTITRIAYNNTNHLLIGKDSATGGTEHFQGSIDDVQIYSRVLTSGEVASLYNANATAFSKSYSGLDTGSYSYQGYDQATDGTVSQTETRTIIFSNSTAPVSNSRSSQVQTNSSTKTPMCGDMKPVGIPDLFQIDADETHAIVYFSPLSGGITDYYISFSERSGSYQHGTLTGQGPSTGVLSFTINYLKPDTCYFFKIRGQNGCMPGDFGQELQMKTRGFQSDTWTHFYRYF